MVTRALTTTPPLDHRYLSDWNFPCTDYYEPNSSDPRGVSGLADWRQPENKIAGDDTLFIAARFSRFLADRVADSRPWLAHLCLHSIHEPHPAMPEYWHHYQNDPDCACVSSSPLPVLATCHSRPPSRQNYEPRLCMYMYTHTHTHVQFRDRGSSTNINISLPSLISLFQH